MWQKFLGILGARWFQFALIPFVIFLWFWITDPSGGADTMLRVQLWAQAFLVTGVAYLIAKAMLGKASSESLYEAALTRNNTAAGIAYAGVCLLRAMVLWGLLAFFAQVQR
jgi:hypothetical protein